MSAMPEGLPVAEGTYEASDAHLKQQISLFGLIALAVSVQVGSGWLLATLAAASIAGPASILTWVLGAVFFAVIGVTWMELGAMLPRSGAGVRYPRLTHGAFLSWFNGWGYLIASLSLPVIEAQAVLTYVGGHWEWLGFLKVVDGTTVLSWTGTLVGFVLLFVFFLLNSMGAKLLSESNKYVTIWKLVIPTVTAALMFTAFSSGNFSIGGGFAPLGGGAVLGALASGGIVFAYSGLRQILDFGGEVVNPQRNIPIAIVVGGLIIPLVIYILLQIGFIGAVDWASAGVRPGDWAGLQGSDWQSAPLLNAVTAAGFAWFATVLLTDAALSPAATGWVWLGIGTRTVYSMSVNRELPTAFQRINRYGTPIVALAACTVLGLLFFFPAPSWYLFVGMVSIALTLSYVMGGPVLAVLRRTAPDFPRPVKLKAVTFWAMSGFVASLLLIYFAGWFPLINLFTVVFVALPLYGAYTSVREGWSRPVPSRVLAGAFAVAWVVIAAGGGWLAQVDQQQAEGGWSFPVYFSAIVLVIAAFMAGLYAVSTEVGRRHIRGGIWMVVTILALLLLAYLGQFGPMDSPPLDSPVDLVVMVVIAVGAYLWAVRAGGPTEELAEILAAQKRADVLAAGERGSVLAAHENGVPTAPAMRGRAETTGS
jgi:amino acid transporter